MAFDFREIFTAGGHGQSRKAVLPASRHQLVLVVTEPASFLRQESVTPNCPKPNQTDAAGDHQLAITHLPVYETPFPCLNVYQQTHIAWMMWSMWCKDLRGPRQFGTCPPTRIISTQSHPNQYLLTIGIEDFGVNRRLLHFLVTFCSFLVRCSHQTYWPRSFWSLRIQRSNRACHNLLKIIVSFI